jgi:hypothetical protein
MTTTSTGAADQQQSSSQRYTGTYSEFVKERQQAAKAAYLQTRHNLIERAVQERKRDIQSRTVTLKDGRNVILPPRSKDALTTMFSNASRNDRE